MRATKACRNSEFRRLILGAALLAMAPWAVSAAPATAGKGFPAVAGVDNVAALVGRKSERIVLTAQDVKTMEPVCILILSHADENGAKWWTRLKPTGLLDRPEYQMARGTSSLHHYCWGQIRRFRIVREPDVLKKRQDSAFAATEFEFVAKHPEFLPEDWPYYAHMFSHAGDMHHQSGNTAAAMTSFKEAIRITPEYPAAYLGLAALYSDLRDNAKALDLIREGLRHNPDSKGLKKRYELLGGRPPYPEPYPKTPPPVPPSEPAPPTAPQPAPTETPESGAPRHCRFCP